MTKKDGTGKVENVNCGLTVDERHTLRRRLGDLPDTMPPRAVWHRIERQARAERLIGRPSVSARLRWVAGAGVAAAVVLAVLNVPAPRSPTELTGASGASETLPTVPAFDPDADAVRYDSINALMVQSMLLEQDLRRLPNQPALGRAGTVATIDDLQARIAAIDRQLNEQEARLTPDQQQIYWRERVRLMDSLLKLRYAQAQRLTF